MASVYDINKGIGRSIVFKGIKAQYILYLAIGLVVLLLLFVILYVLGLGSYLCLGIVLPAGGVLINYIQRMSHKYGEHGLLKKAAQAKLPSALINQSSSTFQRLKHESEADQPGATHI